MFKVPTDPSHPTFEISRKVSFWKWLTSRKAERRKWQHLRAGALRNKAIERAANPWGAAHGSVYKSRNRHIR